MTISLFNPILVLYYFIPVWAFLIWYVPLNHKNWILFFNVLLMAGTFYFLVFPPQIKGISPLLPLYGVSLFSYLYLFSTKPFKPCHVLATSLWVLFIAAEFWEIPAYIFDFFGISPFNTWNLKYNFSQWVFSHVHRLFVLATFILFTMKTNFKFNKKIWLLIITGLIINSFLLFSMTTGRNILVQTIMPRAIGLIICAIIAYIGLKKVGNNDNNRLVCS